MNVLAPVSTIMTSDVISVSKRDKLSKIRDIFNANRIHHIPVTHDNEVVGIISKEDLLLFVKGLKKNTVMSKIVNVNTEELDDHHAEDIMTRGVGKLEPTDRINVALDIFSKNLFKALPVVQDGKLVGIITTFDIIKTLNDETS